MSHSGKEVASICKCDSCENIFHLGEEAYIRFDGQNGASSSITQYPIFRK